MFGLEMITPITLALFAIVFVFLLVLFTLDFRRTSHEKHLRRLMRSFITQHAMKSFTVITTVGNNEDAVNQMVEMLEKQQYTKLQLLILTDSTVTKLALSKLRRLQRQKRNILRITVTRRKANASDTSLIRRYAKSDALLWLHEGERLSADFFTRMSLELLDESCVAIASRMALSVDDSLSTATKALSQVVSQTTRSLLMRNGAEPRIMRRANFLENREVAAVSAEHSTIMVSRLPARSLEPANWMAAAAVVTALSIAALSYIYVPSGWQIVTATAIGTGVLLLALRVMTYPYTAPQMLALLMMIPMWPLSAPLMAVINSTRQILTGMWSHRFKLKGRQG